MRVKRIAALLLSGVIMASMMIGCGSVDKNAAVATLDGEEIPLGVANFAARLQQASYDDFYKAYFGEKVWSSDMYGNGVTMETELKTNILNSMEEMYVLEKHAEEYDVALTEDEKAKIKETASAFISANSKEALEALGATSEIVERYLGLITIQNKMYDAIVADADTNVSDEEANTSAYSYVRISKTTYTDGEGNSKEYTEEEQSALAENVETFAKAAATDGLDAAAETYEYTVSSGTFTKDDETLDESVAAALQKLEEGEVSGVVDTESNYYVVRLDSKTDKEATERTRENIITQRQNDLYKEVLDGWKEGHEWEVDEKVWKTVTFENLFTTTVPTPDTETVQPTEE